MPRLELKPIKGGAVTDGVHRYWQDGQQVRWAFTQHNENDPSFRTHGAQRSLQAAIDDAWSVHRERLASRAPR